MAKITFAKTDGSIFPNENKRADAVTTSTTSRILVDNLAKLGVFVRKTPVIAPLPKSKTPGASQGSWFISYFCSLKGGPRSKGLSQTE
jgi:hypothetical protein